MDKDVDNNGSSTAAGVLIIDLVLLILSAGNCVASRGTHASSGSSIRARLFGANMAYVWFRSTEEGKLEAVVWRPRYVRKVHDPLFSV
jgi:hypothetical protein